MAERKTDGKSVSPLKEEEESGSRGYASKQLVDQPI
jgi:hypothetical protein